MCYQSDLNITQNLIINYYVSKWEITYKNKEVQEKILQNHDYCVMYHFKKIFQSHEHGVCLLGIRMGKVKLSHVNAKTGLKIFAPAQPSLLLV